MHPFILGEYSKNILSGKSRILTNDELKSKKLQTYRIQSVHLMRNSSDGFLNINNNGSGNIPKSTANNSKHKINTFRIRTGKLNNFFRLDKAKS